VRHQILGAFGEGWELSSDFGVPDGTEIGPSDPALLAHYMRAFVEAPFNRDVLLASLAHDPTFNSFDLDDQALCDEILARIARGDLVLVRSNEVQLRITPHVGTAEPPPEPAPPPERRQPEVKIRDWKIECHHHANTGGGSPCTNGDGKGQVRLVIERGSAIQIVPSKGTKKDTVKLWWKDQYLGSLPPSLTVRTQGKPDIEAQRVSGGGDTGTYQLDAEYLGDTEITKFFLPSFWRSFMERTNYSIAPGPTPINVEVYHPKRFKFEFSFPPIKGYKGGFKLETEKSANPTNLFKPQNLEAKFELNQVGWSPSTLKPSSTTIVNTHPDPNADPPSSSMTLGNCKFYIDSVASSFGWLTLVGKLLKLSKTFRDLVTAIKKFKDYAPQVGWYIDFGISLMQGSLAVEWYWKEHTDHRVYQYIDANIAMTLFAIEFEFGIGVGAFSFKLQVFAALSGEIGVEASMKRTSPDGAPGFTLPAFKGKITGALGMRFEAGIFAKFEAKAETAIEAEVALGINQRNSPVSFDAHMRWTGIACTVSGSVGPWGIGGNKTWKSTLVPPSEWVGLEWPKEEPYKPPYLSRDRIAVVLQGVITDGWNIRVINPSGSMFTPDTHLTPEQIAGALADAIDADSLIERDTDTIDGLAHAIRGDLDKLGTRLGRDWIEQSAFNGYIAGKLKERLRAVHSPERLILKANGG
jgi:hypothetical protein